MKKILLITNIPTPYRIPLFNELDRQLKENDIRLTVVFGALGYERRKWEIDMGECLFKYRVLPSRKISFSDVEKTSFTYAGLSKIVAELKPDVIVTNGFSIATTKLWLRSWFKKTSYIIWSGAIEHEGKTDSLLREVQRKLMTSRASGFIAYGGRAKEYLISLGAEDKSIEIGLNTVDTEFFRKKVEKQNKSSAKNDISKRLLCVGHLVRRKRLDLLFQAISDLLKRRKDFILEIVGDGEERKNLESLSERLGISGHVRFEGYKQKADIPGYLERADCFLFTTEYDVWGLVLVEAMAAGVTCISSIHAGVTADLIKEGETGFAMDFSETEKVTQKINWILDNPEEAKKIGLNASQFIAEQASLEKSAQGFVRAISKAMRG